LANVEGARDVGPEQFLPLLDREILERCTKLHTSVIDQNVDGTGSFDHVNAVANILYDSNIKASDLSAKTVSGQVRSGKV
jgi:hypothetical protein